MSDILYLANLMEIPNFVGVQMRDELKGMSKTRECGIVNLNTSSEHGSHWCLFLLVMTATFLIHFQKHLN